MTPLKTDSHTFLSFSEPQVWLSFLDSVNSKPICHLIWRSAKHALECIWQERRKKKKQSDFRSVAVSSWLDQQLSSSAVTRVCVYLCVCGQGTGCPQRNGHGASLSCPALLLQIHKAHSLALQLALCPLPVALSSLYLILSVFLLLLLSVCSDNFDPTLCIITPPPPTEKRQPAHFCLFGNI